LDAAPITVGAPTADKKKSKLTQIAVIDDLLMTLVILSSDRQFVDYLDLARPREFNHAGGHKRQAFPSFASCCIS
jgi:hypothetical protein